MENLDQRLLAVASQVRSGVHADIGSDHGYLLKALLESKSIERGIAIENKERPFRNSLETLDGLNAEVRLADGLAGLGANEADSLSICGIGGVSIVRILEASPERVPDRVVLQPNRRTDSVRIWGNAKRFHLIDELECYGKWNYSVLSFQRSADILDPSYDGLNREAAILFGPHNIRRRHPKFIANLEGQHQHFVGLAARDEMAVRKLEAIRWILGREKS